MFPARIILWDTCLPPPSLAISFYFIEPESEGLYPKHLGFIAYSLKGSRNSCQALQIEKTNKQNRNSDHRLLFLTMTLSKSLCISSSIKCPLYNIVPELLWLVSRTTIWSIRHCSWTLNKDSILSFPLSTPPPLLSQLTYMSLYAF